MAPRTKRRLLVMSVFGRVMLTGLFGVVHGVAQVALRHMRMVTGFFMVARFMVVSGRLVMFSGMFVVFRCFAVMLRGFFGHLQSPFLRQYLGLSLQTRSMVSAECGVSVSFL